MNNEELQAKLTEVGQGLRISDLWVNEKSNGEFTITKRTGELVEKLFEVFQSLRWTLALTNAKELKADPDSKPLERKGLLSFATCGTPVQVRSCRPEHGNKTYFGIYIGELAQSIRHSVKDNVVTASYSMHNPAIFVPELNDIVLGCESWWGKIEDEEGMKKLITDELIQNVWYVKALKEMSKPEAPVAEPFPDKTPTD